jgi:hypothetical protein
MEDFDWEFYVNYYPDLKKSGIGSRSIAFKHYLNHGKAEGRICKKPIIPEYTILPTILIKNLTEQINLIVCGTKLEQTFYSSNITLVQKDNKIYSIIRYVNYIKDVYTPTICYSINKLIIFDNNFNELEHKFFDHTDVELSLKNYIGIEDIKLFNFNEQIYYTGNFVKDRSQISINPFDFSEIKLNLITSLKKETSEKNWCLFERNGELLVVYNWSPLTICKIENNKLVLLSEIQTNIENLRGSTNGCKIPQGALFITHTNIHGNYLHRFALLNETVSFSRYFKFENYRVEFCLGMLIIGEDIVISYSLNDKLTKIVKINLLDLFKKFPVTMID